MVPRVVDPCSAVRVSLTHAPWKLQSPWKLVGVGVGGGGAFAQFGVSPGLPAGRGGL